MVPVKKRIAVLVVVVLLAAAGFYGVRLLLRRPAPASDITLYGNIDIRQVQLAFNDSERINKILVDEGSNVHSGQLLAQLEQQRFLDAAAKDRASMAAQRQVVARLLAGSRPEEIRPTSPQPRPTSPMQTNCIAASRPWPASSMSPCKSGTMPNELICRSRPLWQRSSKPWPPGSRSSSSPSSARARRTSQQRRQRSPRTPPPSPWRRRSWRTRNSTLRRMA